MNTITITFQVDDAVFRLTDLDLAILLGLPVSHVTTRISRLIQEFPVEGERLPPPRPDIHTPSRPLEGRGTIGGRENVSEENNSRDVYVAEERRMGRDRSTPTRPRPVDEALVQEIALTLRDQHSIPFLRTLVEEYPRAMLLSALTITVQAPTGRIAKRPAAYFVGILRNLMKQSEHD